MPEIYLNFQAMYIILHTNYSRYRQRKTQSCMHTVVCTCTHTQTHSHRTFFCIEHVFKQKKRT